MNKIPNKTLFDVLVYHQFWSGFFKKDKLIDKNIFYLFSNESFIKKRDLLKEGLDNLYFYTNYIINLSALTEYLKSKEILNIFFKKNSILSLTKEGNLFIKRMGLEDFFYSRELISESEFMTSRNAFYKNLNNEIIMNNIIVVSGFNHMLINLFPLQLNKEIAKKFSSYSLLTYYLENDFDEVLNYDFSNAENIEETKETVDSILEENMEISGAGADSLDNILYLITENTPLFQNLTLYQINENRMIIPQKIKEELGKDSSSYIELINEIENIFDDITKSEQVRDYFNYLQKERFFSFVPENIFLASKIDEAYKQIDKWSVISSESLEKMIGLSLISSFYYLKEKGVLKNIPGIFDLEKKEFYFKNFSSIEEMSKYAFSFFKDFMNSFYGVEKENIFLKKYIIDPFNNYFAKTGSYEKALLLDNYIRKSGFVSKLLKTLSLSNVKDLIKEDYKIYNEEKENYYNIMNYIKSSEVSHFLRIYTFLLKGNGTYYPSLEELKEKEAKAKTDSTIAALNFILDLIYKNQEKFDFENIDIENFYMHSELLFDSENDVLRNIEEKKDNLFFFIKYAFSEAVSTLISVNLNFKKERQKLLNLLDEEEHPNWIHILEDDFEFSSFIKILFNEESLLIYKDSNQNIILEFTENEGFQTALTEMDLEYDYTTEFGKNYSFYIKDINSLENALKTILNKTIIDLNPDIKKEKEKIKILTK